MGGRAYLGLDAGSAYTKAVAIDEEGRVLASALRETGVRFAASASQQRASSGHLSPTVAPFRFAPRIGRKRAARACTMPCCGCGGRHRKILPRSSPI